MTFKIIQQSKPLRWLCPHCEMEIEAEMLSAPDPERAYVCFFCGWRRSLAMMEYYGFVRPAIGDMESDGDEFDTAASGSMSDGG